MEDYGAVLPLEDEQPTHTGVELAIFGKFIPHDVWPDQRESQADFLTAYARCGILSRAVVATGVPLSTHYKWLRTDPDYGPQFINARRMAGFVLEEEAIRRAHDGVDKPVYQGGKLAGYVKEYSDTLMIFMLKGLLPDIHRERYDVNVNGSLRINIGGGDDLPDGI